jgi:phage tail sheath protein FI
VPAGIDAPLRGLSDPSYVLTDAESELLDQAGINTLRTFPDYRTVPWGARTLARASAGSEWRYVPVRRLALFLQESLWRGLQWVVFEPNNEGLWSAIRRHVDEFLHGVFVQGAFVGQTPGDSYLVRCDSSTTSQSDLNQGLVSVVIGFAPLRPAEFVMLRITLLTGAGPRS